MRLIAVLSTLLFVNFAQALPVEFYNFTEQFAKAATTGLDWQVGDRAEYNLKMGFIKGTSKNSVREITAEGLWMVQDMDLGFAGKQLVEVLIDPNTGEIKKLIANGEEQQIPEAGNQEVIEYREDNITVPAGNFDCVYVKIRDTKENKESEVWINPSIVPMGGMIKQISPGQLGNVVLELTSFEKK